MEVIGGAEKYIATCRSCHHLPVDESPRKLKEMKSVDTKIDKPRMFGNEINVNGVTNENLPI